MWGKRVKFTGNWGSFPLQLAAWADWFSLPQNRRAEVNFSHRKCGRDLPRGNRCSAGQIFNGHGACGGEREKERNNLNFAPA